MKRIIKQRITRFLRILLIPAFAAAVVLIASQYAMSHSAGITGYTNKVGDGQGCTCHCNASNNATTVTISTNATSFETGQTYTFTISVSNGNEVKAGCDIATQFGSLAAGNDGLQALNGQLTQTAPKALAATWTFTYTAPNTAEVDTIFATGNAVNNDGTNGAGNCTDKWNFATKYLINVTNPLRTLIVTRPTISFGNKRVGGTYTDTLHLNSVGNAAVSVTSQSMKTGNPITNSPTSGASISAGSNELQTITFQPVSRGQYSDSLVVISNANNNTLSNPGDQGSWVTGQGINAVFTGQTLVPANTLMFGNVRVGQNATLTYNFTNTGDDTLFLNAAPSIGGANASSFVITTNSPTMILAGASASVTIKFSPTIMQAYSATLDMSAANGVTIPTINLGGIGTSPILTVFDVTDVGTGRVGGVRNGSVAISNGGSADLNISSITLGNQYQAAKFQISATTPMQIPPSGNSTINVTYSPTSERKDSAVVTILSDDDVNPSKQIMIVGTGGLPKMPPISPDSIKFGNVRVGSTAQNFSLQIGNTGTFDLQVNSIDVSPSQFTAPSKPATVSPNGSGQVTLQFMPTAAGSLSGMAIVHSDDANNQNDTVYLSGVGTISSFDVPSGVAFGDVKLNTSRDTLLKLRNLGTAAVKILGYSLTDPNNGFVLIDSTVHTIGAHDSATIDLRFNAFQEISYSGTLSITTDESASSTRQIQLSGRAVNSKLQLSVSSLDFGTIDTGTHAQKSLTITNNGTATASISSFTLSGANVAEFSVDSPKSAVTIAASGTSKVLLSFNPTTVGTASATLTVGATEGTKPEVLLSGVGKAKPQSGSVRMIDQVVNLLEVVPNPASNAATLKIGVTSHLEDVKLTYYNDAGQLLSSQYVGTLSDGLNSVPLTLPQVNGVAFVRITAGGEMIATVQIVITR
ncbi:MAG TPA: choice-of-anchor D domain-containing protein [Candidatus Kapabacteria bacterium]|nr:choice-of-anchor D domain-containing protein [Candidatus Kapabacteria bacterium]